MVERRRLVRTGVEALECRDRAYDVHDAVVPQMMVRVQPSGARSYLIRYRPKGAGRAVNPRSHKLGDHPAITPEQARDLAREALADIAAGQPPRLSTQDRRLTVGAVLDAYLLHLAGRPSHRDIEGKVRLHLRPRLGGRLAGELVAEDVQAMSDALRKAGKRRTAAGCVVVLRAALRRAGVSDVAAAAVKASTWRRRRRAASRPELREVLTACRALLAQRATSPWAVYLIVLLIITGARPIEIRTARRDEIDHKAGRLVLGRHKGSWRGDDVEPREIDLPPAAIEVIAAMPPRAGNPWLIPGRVKGRPLQTYASVWARICRIAKVEGLRVQDLRRTFASLGLGAGYSLAQIGKALGHSHQSTTDGYAWLLPDIRRELAERVGREIAGLLDSPDASS